MQPAKRSKIVFSPSNADEYERLFRNEYDVAMGYRELSYPRAKSIVDTANPAFPVPDKISPLDRAQPKCKIQLFSGT